MIVPQRLTYSDLLTRKNCVGNYVNLNKDKKEVRSVNDKVSQRAISENAILASLSASDFQRIQPNLEIVDLKPDRNLYNAGDEIRHIYFPLDSVVYLFTTLKDGATIEIGVIGSEGMLGFSALFGETEMPNQARVLSDTKAVRIPADLLKHEFKCGGTLNHLVLNYVHAFYMQVFQTAACNSHHSLKHKLCRWLLMTHNRMKADRIDVTQEFISQMLGTRRPYITAAVGLLQKEKIISGKRGYIEILDLPALKSRCCECYEVMK